jgi:hypothetical protein
MKKTHDAGIERTRGSFVEALYCDFSFVYSCIKKSKTTMHNIFGILLPDFLRYR